MTAIAITGVSNPGTGIWLWLFAQLTYRESLLDIEACSRPVGGKLYRAGSWSRIARSTLTDAKETHDWRIFADFAQVPSPTKVMYGHMFREAVQAYPVITRQRRPEIYHDSNRPIILPSSVLLTV